MFITRGFPDAHYGQYNHPGPYPLRFSEFDTKVRWLNNNPDSAKLLDNLAKGDPILWNHIFASLAGDLLTVEQQRSITQRYTGGEAMGVGDMTPEQRRQLGQALLTRISTILRHPLEEQDESEQEGQ